MEKNVQIAKALSDPIRYKIMLMLAANESECCQNPFNQNNKGLCNCELMAELGLIQSRVSYHMKELTDAGLVTEEPRGKWKYYMLNTEALKDYIKKLEVDFKI